MRVIAAASLALVFAGCKNAEVYQVPTDAAPTTMRAPDAFTPATAPIDVGPRIELADAPPEAAAPIREGCNSPLNADGDQDGYTSADGDCNDCDKQANPGAFDVPANMIDEDCSGKPDDEPAACDEGIAIEGDALAAAKAIGICRTASLDARGKARTWGLIKAAYVFPDGSTGAIRAFDHPCGTAGDPPNPLSHGVLPMFGTMIKPREGTRMAALSSGVARAGKINLGRRGSSPGGAKMCTRSLTPMGFPVSSYSTCGDLKGQGSSTNANDAIALELTIRAPTNASALSFDFDFYTFEYSEFVCSDYNDAFVALLFSRSPEVPPNRNVAFDSQKNPVSVNNGFVEVCTPFTYEGRTAGGQPFMRRFPCALGTGQLEGTGFEGHAATGWLQTQTNIVPGEELTLRFAIWDAGDEILDSTVLIDNFKWATKPGMNVTVRPPIE
jgi:hypothetical protein